MCRNITPLRGLQPPATDVEIEAAARQYARKIAAASTGSSVLTSPAFELAVQRIAEATSELLASLPERRTPPTIEPPLRRRRPTTS
jgi:hypothetical protein